MPNLNLPKNMQFIDHGNYLEIVRIWRGWETLGYAGIAVVVWGAPLVFLEDVSFGGSGEEYMWLLLFLAVGVGSIYHVLASFFNKTYIFANESKIEVRHRPIPWLGNRKVDAKDIVQLYVKEVVDSDPEGGSSTDYQLRAKVHSGKEITMLSGVPDADQAKFVEDKLEALLHIKNQPVSGEYGKSDSVASDIPVRNAGEILTTETFDYNYWYLFSSGIGTIGLVLLVGGILIPGWLALKLLFSAFGVVLIVMTCASTVRVTVSRESFTVSYLLPLRQSRTVLWDDIFDLEFVGDRENFLVYITQKSKRDHSQPDAKFRLSSGAVKNSDRLRLLLEQGWENSKMKT